MRTAFDIKDEFRDALDCLILTESRRGRLIDLLVEYGRAKAVQGALRQQERDHRYRDMEDS